MKTEVDGKNINVAIHAALIGYDELRKGGIGFSLISKGDVDACTELDLKLEDRTREYIKAKTEDSVFGEERKGDRNASWILDKIDGTPNFKGGLDMFGSAVTHLNGNSADITAVVLPKQAELYLAVKGKGTHLLKLPNRVATDEIVWNPEEKYLRLVAGEISKKLRTTTQTLPRDIQIGADVGYKNREEKLVQVAKYASEVFYCPIFGSASYSLCQVATGRLGGYVIFDVDMNDIFSGQLLVEEAGGVTSGLNGEPVTRETRTLVATGNKTIHDFLLKRLDSQDIL